MLHDFLTKIDLTGKHQLERVFAGREPLSPDSFYLKYFQNQGYPKETVIRIKQVFDSHVGFDLTRLSAEDDFSKELKFIWTYDSLADVETIVGLEKEFGIKIEDAEAERMKTIKDVVEIIHAKLNNGKV